MAFTANQAKGPQNMQKGGAVAPFGGAPSPRASSLSPALAARMNTGGKIATAGRQKGVKTAAPKTNFIKLAQALAGKKY